MSHIFWSKPKRRRQRWYVVATKHGVGMVKATDKKSLLAWLLEKYPEKAPFKILTQPKGRYEP